jgi:SPP1 gp7 family putative phage head morphogenesis protein
MSNQEQPKSKAEQKAIEKKLKSEKKEADRIAREAREKIERTVMTRSYNQSRYTSFRQSKLATHWRFLAIEDDRCCEICSSRNGCVWSIDDSENIPPCHEGCRCTASVLMPKINPKDQSIVNDPLCQPDSRSLIPVPEGWVNGIIKE